MQITRIEEIVMKGLINTGAIAVLIVGCEVGREAIPYMLMPLL